MSFPADPRDLKLWLAFGHNDAEDPTGVTFEQVSPDPVDSADPGPLLGGITITRGRVGDAPLVSATQIEFALRDTDGDFSPRNVTGAHYGELRNSTPAQVTVDGGFGDQALATAYVPEWNPTWRGPNIDDKVSITAEGILAKLGRDTEVKSALRRAFEVTADIVAYWPMEDAGGTFSSGLPGGLPLTLSGEVDFASASDRTGSAPLPVFTSTTAVQGTVDADFNDRWYVSWLMKFEAVPSVRTTLMDVYTTGGSADRWVLEADSTTLYLTAYRAGVSVYSGTSTSSKLLLGPTGWIGLLLVVVDASTFSFTIYDLSTTSIAGVQIFDGGIVAGSVTDWRIPASSGLADIPMGHVGVFNLTQPDEILIPNGPEPLNGYDGETTSDRVIRVCSQSGITVQTFGTDFQQIGPQLPATTLQILRDCEAVDRGVLTERRDGRLGFDSSSVRYNAAVALTLEYGTEAEPGDIANLRQFDDNRDLRNRVTVTRLGGTSATVEERDGPVGIDEIGVRPLPVTLNLYEDSQVPIHAGYLLRAGTVDKPRYVIVLNLIGAPSLAVNWLFTDLGNRIQITGAPSKHVGPDVLDLIVESERIELDADRWLVTMWCEPYEPWRVQQLTETPPDDDLLDGWLIPDVFALRAAVDADDTSWVADCWPRMTTDADDMPCRITRAGEESAITAVATTAATYVAVGAADHDDNAAVTPGDYAGGAVGDWVVVIAGSRDTTSPTLAITDPNYTYDLLTPKQGGLYVWAAFRTASTPAPTVTPTGGASGDTVSAQVFGLRGMPITGSPSDWVLDFVGQTNASAQDIAYGRLEPGGYAGRVLLVVARKSDDWTSASIAVFSEITETTSTSGNDQSLYAARRIDTTPAEVAAGSITVTGGTTAVSDSLVIALQGGYQTFTVTRSVNDVEKSHAVGSEIELLDPLVLTL